MASSLSAEANKRKQSLRNLSKLSRRLDAEQEKLEREIKRILNRKRAVPDLADIDRIVKMCAEISACVNDLNEGALIESQNWALF